jgi:6-phosphogluconate dehydrogenase (decarboxylating)
MNKERADKIIEQATEVSDGLFLFINQGQKIADCTQYTTSEDELYTVDIYEPKDLVNFEPVMNVTFAKQDFDFDLYEVKKVYRFGTRAEMHAFLLELMQTNWF